MLMNVVFPAPFVPMRPTTESFSIAALTPSAAVTAPKLLLRFCASRIGLILDDVSGALPPRKQRPKPLGQEHDRGEQRQPHAHLPGVRRQAVGDRMNRP